MVVGLVVAWLLVGRDGRHDVAPRRVEAPRASPAAAAEVLAAFVAGVGDRDRSALEALAADDEAARVLAGTAANARSLDLREVTARYVDQAGTVAADGSWSGVVEMTWRIGDLDPAAARSDVVVRFAPVDGSLGLAGFGGAERTGGSRLPLWLRGRLAVVRTPDALVVVEGPRSDASALARRVSRGRDVVRRVLPRWTTPVVVEVPSGAAALDETLGAEPGTYAGVAAVTTTPGNEADDDAPVHVFVNRDESRDLGREGAQVVMSHELVHVATDAVRSRAEPWLVEGFADYVALRDTRLPDRVTLGRAIAAVRRDGVPEDLPTATDLDTRAEDLQAAYEESWLASRLVAEQVGEDGLVEVYAEASAGRPLPGVLRRGGLPLERLTSLWRDRLRGVAG